MNEISIQQGQVSTRTSVRETADACDQKEMSVRNALGLLFCDSRLIHQFIWCVSGEKKKKCIFLKMQKMQELTVSILVPWAELSNSEMELKHISLSPAAGIHWV